jgi:hypothetical protein
VKPLNDYNRIADAETIQVTLTLTTSSSDAFLLYLITNDVKEFGFDVIITALEQID